MANVSDPTREPPTRTTGRRWSAILIIAMAALSLAASGMSFWYGGRQWSGLTIPIALILLGSALLVGRERRTWHYGFLGASLCLIALSWWLLFTARP